MANRIIGCDTSDPVVDRKRLLIHDFYGESFREKSVKKW